MSKIAAYLRVSTLDQSSGLQSQESAIQQYLDSHGMTNVKFYRDKLSGATTNRPAFAKLQRDIFSGKTKTVVCWKLDRLSRSLQDGVSLLSEWTAKDIRVIAISQQLDFGSSMGQLLSAVFFALAAMERENLRENTKRGLAAARARGVKLGKRPRLFAADITPLQKQGMSVKSIAEKLGCSRQAVYAALQRETA